MGRNQKAIHNQERERERKRERETERERQRETERERERERERRDGGECLAYPYENTPCWPMESHGFAMELPWHPLSNPWGSMGQHGVLSLGIV